MKKHGLFSLSVCLLFVFTACDKNQETPVTEVSKAEPEPSVPTVECVLKMGWDPWEPYQYLTPEDKVEGLEVDLLSAIANEAGCDITFVQDNWVNLLTGIRNGSIDMLGGATKTASRETFAYFSDGYRRESFSLYIRSGEAENFSDKSLQDLLEGGFRLGVTQDYLYGDEVNAFQDDDSLSSAIVSVPITEVNYYNLTQGVIDGFLEDPFVADFTIRRKGLQGQIEVLTPDIHSSEVSIIFSRESVSEETVQAFNAGLAQLKSSGEYDAILAKYQH